LRRAASIFAGLAEAAIARAACARGTPALAQAELPSAAPHAGGCKAVGQNATGCADRVRGISIVTEIADVFAAPDWTTLPTMRRSGRDAAGFFQLAPSAPDLLDPKANLSAR
jgi:hypothetical protein